MKRLSPLLLLILPMALASCSAMKSFKDSTVAMVGKLPSLPTPSWLGDHPNVAQVREKDLKKMPLGKERALAYRNGGGYGIWPAGDVKFTPGVLPTTSSEVDPSLLPPP